jgi:DNA replication and repair protein RecF
LGDLTILVGENAQGKTNILEGIYVLSLGKSHRTRSHKELIQFGQSVAKLKARVEKEKQTHRLEVILLERGKKVSRNGVEQSKLSQYIGFLPTVLFAPEHLAIVKGSPQIRRRFLDLEIGQISPSYVYYLSQLNQVLHQRNACLRKLDLPPTSSQNALLDVIDDQFISLSVQIWKKRFQFLKKLTNWAQEIHKRITQNREDLFVSYLPSIPVAAEMTDEEMGNLLKAHLLQNREKEIKRAATLFGPHRDDFQLMADQLNIHVFGSQGQQRTAALSLKLAEIELIFQETGHYPILLLDDVLSELDDSRKTHLLEAIRGKVQTFVTTTSLDGIDEETLERSRIFRVSKGTISELG